MVLGGMRPQTSRLRRWMPPTRPIAVLLGLLLLTSCASLLHKPVPPPPPPPPSKHKAAVQPWLHAAWSFQMKKGSCLATAVAGRFRLVVAVHGKTPVRISVILPYETTGRSVAYFHGPAGAWSVAGWHAGPHEIVFGLGHGMDSLSRVLMLLSGGVVDLDSPAKNLPIFILPASGAEGQRWFSCARQLVI